MFEKTWLAHNGGDPVEIESNSKSGAAVLFVSQNLAHEDGTEWFVDVSGNGGDTWSMFKVEKILKPAYTVTQLI
jgi:hypothetical protein